MRKWLLNAILVVVACSLIIVAVAPLAYASWWKRTHNLQPLLTPTSLKKGEYTSPYFTTDLNVGYEIQLDWDRFPDALAQLDLNWRVVDDNGAVVKQGTYSGPIRGGDGVTLGEYRPHRGLRQRIFLEMHEDAIEFDAHHPRLEVSVPETLLESSGFEIPVAIGRAVLVALFGVATLLIIIMIRRTNRRTIDS